MTNQDFKFVPHCDMSPNELSIVEQHNDLIKQNKYSDASAFLDSNYKKGFRASLFNCIEKKIRDIEIYLLNKVIAEPDEFYSMTEPTEEQMNGKTYWIQIQE